MVTSEKTRQSNRPSCACYKAAFATCLIFGMVGLPLTFLGCGNRGVVVFLHGSWTPSQPGAEVATAAEVVPAAGVMPAVDVVPAIAVEPAAALSASRSLETMLLENLRSLDGPAPETVEGIDTQWQVVHMKVTAYCACPLCCGKHADGITANNHRIRPGDVFVAADKQIPFGTEMVIPGYNGDRPVEVMDRGRLIKGNRLDVFMHSHQQAKRWGCRELDVLVKVD